MNQPKFKPGDIALYQIKNELVEIKEVFTMQITKRMYLKQDGISGPATGPEYTDTTYRYSIHTHTGSTAAFIEEHLLAEIPNAYAFHIVRRLADTDKERAHARELLDYINFKFQQKTNSLLIGMQDNDVALIPYQRYTEPSDQDATLLVELLRRIIFGYTP